MTGDRCACGHDAATQHDGDGRCICCLCPEPHDEVRMIPTLMNGRWELLLPSHRAYRTEWTTPPFWEPERIGAMAEVVGPGDVVYDVGAEEGDMAALWASWGAEVVLIEPGHRVWPNPKAIWNANGLPPPLATYVGFCGDAAQERLAHPSEPPLTVGGWPSCADGPLVGDHGFAVIVERPDIPATTVDALAAATKPPTVITIDVEGAELCVLRGARRTLIDHRPDVFVSVHADLRWMAEKFEGDEFDALDAYMRDLGYEGRHLATDHEKHMHYRYTENG